jgi:hypothetical protein
MSSNKVFKYRNTVNLLHIYEDPEIGKILVKYFQKTEITRKTVKLGINIPYLTTSTDYLVGSAAAFAFAA